MSSVLPLPETPGRGRSRFSKVLPPAPSEAEKSPYINAPLPPLPPKKMNSVSISRRPVGAPGGRKASVASASSTYSDAPGLSRSLSDSTSSLAERDSLSGVESDFEPSPPLPATDDQRKGNLPSTVPKLQESPISGFNSPPRTEIWRRRSVRSDRSFDITELKLQKSNGSTFASPPRKQEQPERPIIPRSVTGRKPIGIPARPAPPQPEVMGNKLGKLKTKKSLESSSGEESSGASSTKYETPYHPNGIARLPTPDYVVADHRNHPAPVLSPTSPFTPPDDAAPPSLPTKSTRRASHGTPSDDPRGSESTIRSPTDHTHSRQTSEATIVSRPALRSPLSENASATTTKAILSPQSPVVSPTTPLALPSPATQAQAATAHFPSMRSPQLRGSIVPGLPLTEANFDCYQEHRYMRHTRNERCPVACMVCGRGDKEMRWRCIWCCLSACGGCMQVLSSMPGKDLRRTLERIENRESRSRSRAEMR